MVSSSPLEGGAFRECEGGAGGLDFQQWKKRVKSNEEEAVLPSEFQALDRVVFKGGSASSVPNFIDTGLVPKSDWKILVEFAPADLEDNGCLWCARAKGGATAEAAQITLFYNVAAKHPRHDFLATQSTLKNVNLIPGKKHVFLQDGNKFYIDNLTTPVVTGTETEFTAGDRLVLLACYTSAGGKPSSGGARGALYKAKIWGSDGAPLKNYVPCRVLEDIPAGSYGVTADVPAGTVGFFEAVSQTFSTHTGTWIDSDFPVGYTQVDHVDASGNSGTTAKHYIDTGLTPENGGKIEVVFTPTSMQAGNTKWNGCLWCARASMTVGAASSCMDYFYHVTSNGGTDSWSRLNFYDTSYDLEGLVNYEKYTFTLDGNKFYIDGQLKATGTETAFTAGDRLVLFGSYASVGAVPAGNGANGWIYSAKVWDKSRNLLLDLVPCKRDSDGVYGFYDRAGDRGFVTTVVEGAAFTCNDTFTWKPTVAEGEFTDGANWTQNMAPVDGKYIDFNNVNANVRISSDVTINPSTFRVMGDVPTANHDYEYVFDATGGALRRRQTGDGSDGFPCPNWSGSRWVSDNLSYSAFAIAGKTSGSSVYRWQLIDGVLQANFHPTNIVFAFKSGTLDASGNGGTVGISSGSAYGAYTNHTLFTMSPGTLLAMQSGLVNSPSATLINDGGTIYGAFSTGWGGKIVMNGGKMLIQHGDSGDPDFKAAYDVRSSITLGSQVGSISYLELHQDAKVRNYDGNTGSGCALKVANKESSFAKVSMDGTSTLTVLGQTSGAAFPSCGSIVIGATENSTGVVEVAENATMTANNRCRIADAAGSRGYLTLADQALFNLTNAKGDGLRIGTAESAEAVVTVNDEAVLQVPKVFSVPNATAGFVRSELVVNGGVVQTAQINGSNTLSVVVNGGVFRASGASTAEAPFIDGLQSVTVAEGVRVIIDTQDFDVYVNQDFGEGVTVEKRGTGTLYVAGPSSHEVTIVYSGAIVKTDESFAFGQIIMPLDAATWNAAEPANWSDWTSWDPEGLVAGLTAVTVDKAAEINLEDGDEAKSLTVTADGSLSLSGETTLTVNESVNVTGDGAAKVWNVAEGSSVEIVTPAFAAATTAFKKTGDGRLAFDFSTINADVAFVDGAASGVHPLEVSGGELCIRGKKPSQVNSKLVSGTGVSQTTYIGNGARLVYDSCAASGRNGPKGSFYAGYEGAGNGTFVLVNGAMMIGTTYVGYQPTVPCVATLAVTNASVIANAGQSVQFGSVASDAQAANLTAIARFGTGAKVTDCGGGTADGRVAFGVGMDVEFADGASIELGNPPFPNDLNHHRSWICANNRAFGSVRFVRGGTMTFRGGLMVNNYNTTVSAERNLVVGFDGGVLHPTITEFVTGREEVRELRYAIFRAPEYQGFEALADGMTVDMSDCVRYTIAAPVRGDGVLTKTGAGVLVLGKGRTFASTWKSSFPCTDVWVSDSAKVVESGVVTVQNAGGVHVAEGTVEVEEGATDVNSSFIVDAGCTVDLAGNAVALGALKGEGEVSGGTISAVCFKPLAEGESAATLKNVSVGKVYVDFGGAAVKGTASLIAKVGTGVTGKMAGKTFRAKAVNTGDASLKAADCTVDDAGNVFATPVPTGLLLMVR